MPLPTPVMPGMGGNAGRAAIPVAPGPCYKLRDRGRPFRTGTHLYRHASEHSPSVRPKPEPWSFRLRTLRDGVNDAMVEAMAPSPPRDEEAVTAAPGADGDGFDQFLREHQAALIGFLARRAGDEDAKDIAQEAMVRLMRYRAQPAEQLRPLMYRIALNVLNDRGRRDSTRQASAHVSLDQDFPGLASSEPSHDQRIAHEQELALVRAAILQMPERCRQVYLLNRIEGMSYSQIASHCGISVKAVEKHIGKALGLLRLKLKQSGISREDPS